jgi:hypothetical protein
VKHNQGTMPPTWSFVGGGVFASFSAGKKKRKYNRITIPIFRYVIPLPETSGNQQHELIQEMDSTPFSARPKMFAHHNGRLSGCLKSRVKCVSRRSLRLIVSLREKNVLLMQ